MDVGTIFGIVFGASVLLTAILMGSGLRLFWDLHGFMIVVGGIICTIFIAFPAKEVATVAKVIKQTLSFSQVNGSKLLKIFIEFATLIRKEGPVKLPGYAKKQLDYDFLYKGLQLLAENAPEAKIRKILSLEMGLYEKRAAVGRDMLTQMARFGPAFGMIGTLIGLCQMFSKLDDPKAIGPAMAVAILATFYGAVLANMFFAPMAVKLKRRADTEVLLMQMIIEGIAMLRHGESSILIEDRLLVYLSDQDMKAYRLMKSSATAASPAKAAA